MITHRSLLSLNSASLIKNYVMEHSIEKINEYCIEENKYPFNENTDKNEIIQSWLLLGLDTSAIHNKDGNTFLFFTQNLLYLSWLKQLKKLDVNSLNKNGQSALFNADKKKMEFLIKEKIDINVIDNNGRNALFFAHKKIEFNYLIEKGIDLNIITKQGTTIFDENKALLSDSELRFKLLKNMDLRIVKASKFSNWSKKEKEYIIISEQEILGKEFDNKKTTIKSRL